MLLLGKHLYRHLPFQSHLLLEIRVVPINSIWGLSCQNEQGWEFCCNNTDCLDTISSSVHVKCATCISSNTILWHNYLCTKHSESASFVESQIKILSTSLIKSAHIIISLNFLKVEPWSGFIMKSATISSNTTQHELHLLKFDQWWRNTVLLFLSSSIVLWFAWKIICSLPCGLVPA